MNHALLIQDLCFICLLFPFIEINVFTIDSVLVCSEMLDLYFQYLAVAAFDCE